jgi:hypothetical protein
LMPRLRLLVFLLFATGCPHLPAYPCDNTDELCLLKDGTDGKCVPYRDGKTYCIFPALDCPSMWRWEELAPLEIRETCAEPAVVPGDAGVGDARADANGDLP